MGYEVQYSFHLRKEEGGYDTDQTETKIVKVGKPFDDTTLDKVASGILSQLARRDIWVVDVKVFELVKNEISYKESKDGKGIVLKNKKYSLAGSSSEVVEEEEVIPVASAAAAANVNLAPASGLRPSHQVLFEPEDHPAHANWERKYKLTKGRRYMAYGSPVMKGMVSYLTVKDNTGQLVAVDDSFFVNAGNGLTDGGVAVADGKATSIDLSYGDTSGNWKIPGDIRSR